MSFDGGKLASVGMGNVFEKEKQEQVIALWRLGWSLCRIEASTSVRRETAGVYLRSAGIALRSPGGWGRKPPAKPANEVITGFLPGVRLPEQGGKRQFGASEAYREMIELELSRGRNAMGIYQDLVDRHGFRSSYQSVQGLVRKQPGAALPEARAIIETRQVKNARLITALGRLCAIQILASTGAHDFSCRRWAAVANVFGCWSSGRVCVCGPSCMKRPFGG